MATRRLSESLQTFPFEDINRYYQKALDFGIIDVIRHPVDYADTLIRLGYEPFPPLEESHFFYKSLVLPSLSKYVYYLYTIDGFTGIFRGLVPHVSESLLNRHIAKYIGSLSPFPPKPFGGGPRLIDEWNEDNVGYFIQTRFWDLLGKLVALHISHPLHVLSVRTMARFVSDVATKEGYRPSVPESWLNEVWTIRSFWDLYLGCEARVFREITYAVISGASYLVITKIVQKLQINRDPSQRDLIERGAEFIGHSFGGLYSTPFLNASDIMIINQVSDIPLGNPPFNEPFQSCWDCFINLREDRKWKHAALLADRGFVGPIDFLNGHIIPKSTFFGPFYMPRDAKRYEDTPYFLRDYYDVWQKMGISPGAFFKGLQNAIAKKGEKLAEKPGGIKSLSSDRAPSMLSSHRGSFTTVYYRSGIPFRF